MRSVFVHLRASTEAEVEAFLDASYRAQGTAPWVCEIEGNACLYIELYRDHAAESEPEDRAALLAEFGGVAPISVIANVSGRWPGDDQVRDFVRLLLGRFGGVAQDEYSDHRWSLEEVMSGAVIDGHPYFDYRAKRW